MRVATTVVAVAAALCFFSSLLFVVGLSRRVDAARAMEEREQEGKKTVLWQPGTNVVLPEKEDRKNAWRLVRRPPPRQDGGGASTTVGKERGQRERQGGG